MKEDKQLPKAQGAAFIIRHAQRMPLLTLEDVIAADLTPQGWDDAKAFGRRLGRSFSLQSIYCSPILRCIHTAEAILEGCPCSLPIRQHWWLFSPFLVPSNSNNSKPQNEIAIHSSLHEAEKAITSLDKRNLRLILQRVKIPEQVNHLTLYITHDSTIAPLAGLLQGEDMVYVEDYPAYLEGILLTGGLRKKYEHKE